MGNGGCQYRKKVPGKNSNCGWSPICRFYRNRQGDFIHQQVGIQPDPVVEQHIFQVDIVDHPIVELYSEGCPCWQKPGQSAKDFPPRMINWSIRTYPFHQKVYRLRNDDSLILIESISREHLEPYCKAADLMIYRNPFHTVELRQAFCASSVSSVIIP